MQKPVLECIATRRSIRSYQPQPVPHDLLEQILEAAVFAPSGSNNQSWLFTVLQNPRQLATLNGLVRSAFLALPQTEGEYPAKAAARQRAQKEDYNFSYHAPVLIIASNQAGYANAMADCSTALQNIFLSAHALGLGSCWINQLRWLEDDPGIRAYLADLGLPREHTICGAAAVGYAARTLPAPPARKPGTINWVD